MENFYDMTRVSKNTVNTNKRIQQQSADFLKEYDKNLRESLQAKEDKKLNDAMASARFGYASTL